MHAEKCMYERIKSSLSTQKKKFGSRIRIPFFQHQTAKLSDTKENRMFSFSGEFEIFTPSEKVLWWICMCTGSHAIYEQKKYKQW